MGVWLPPNFEYVNDSCIQSVFPNNMSFANPSQSTILGGTNLIWDLNYSLGKASSVTQQFKYSPEGVTPVASTWVYPQQQSVGASWNDSVWWYNVTSTATDNDNTTTTVNAVVIFNQENSDIALVTYTIQ